MEISLQAGITVDPFRVVYARLADAAGHVARRRVERRVEHAAVCVLVAVALCGGDETVVISLFAYKKNSLLLHSFFFLPVAGLHGKSLYMSLQYSQFPP